MTYFFSSCLDPVFLLEFEDGEEGVLDIVKAENIFSLLLFDLIDVVGGRLRKNP